MIAAAMIILAANSLRQLRSNINHQQETCHNAFQWLTIISNNLARLIYSPMCSGTCVAVFHDSLSLSLIAVAMMR